MGTGERSSILTVVFRLSGHSEIGPKPEFDQSRARMSAPFSPPPNGMVRQASSGSPWPYHLARLLVRTSFLSDRK